MAETVLISAPAEEPITLAEARLHVRADDTTDDTLISALIVAARERAEHETGRRLITQTREMVLDAFPSSSEAIQLHAECVTAQSIASIEYLNDAGSWITFGSTNYALDARSLPGYVFLASGSSWPTPADSANAVRIRVVCGYGNAASVPQTIKQWMLLQIGANYENRESLGDAKELPGRFVDGLLDPHRVYV